VCSQVRYDDDDRQDMNRAEVLGAIDLAVTARPHDPSCGRAARVPPCYWTFAVAERPAASSPFVLVTVAYGRGPRGGGARQITCATCVSRSGQTCAHTDFIDKAYPTLPTVPCAMRAAAPAPPFARITRPRRVPSPMPPPPVVNGTGCATLLSPGHLSEDWRTQIVFANQLWAVHSPFHRRTSIVSGKRDATSIEQGRD
jgi:hypothetical protein